MLTINRRSELEAFESQRALVTLFLDNAFSDHVIGVVMDAKWGFNAQVGPAWHLLIPYQQGFAVDRALSPRAYDGELSREIVDARGIPNRQLPAILFENYDGDEDAYYLSLADLSDQQIITTIGDIADIVMQQFKNGRSDPQEFRADVTNAIKVHQRLRALVTFAKRQTGNAIGILGWVQLSLPNERDLQL